MVSRWLTLAGGGLVFAVLATANSGGYRYGISDQAFYVPAVVRAADPGAFPRDGALIDAQAALMLSDELLAAVSQTTGLDLPAVHFALYLVTMAALCAAAVALSRALNGSWWMVALLGVMMTFRHRIAKTGANSLEGYAHPRMLAFALGAIALACALRARWGWTAVLVAVSAALHTTTAIWFALLLGAAFIAMRPDRRRWLLIAAVLAVVAGDALWIAGALDARLIRMDDEWLRVLQEKDYLFPTDWPAYAWILNLSYLLIVAVIYRRRRALGVTAPAEPGVVAGLGVLLAVFVISAPLTAWKLALAVQMQVTRVFWLLDLAALAYLAWWLADAPRKYQPQIRAAALGVLLLFSVGRGVFLLTGAQSDRALVQLRLPQGTWLDAMAWLRGQPKTWHVLADPGHAWKYGIAVRLGAERDTLLESGKDSALAMYDRGVAMRVAERTSAIGDFERLSADRVRALDELFALDALVAESRQHLDLPVLYRNERFVIYDLR